MRDEARTGPAADVVLHALTGQGEVRAVVQDEDSLVTGREESHH